MNASVIIPSYNSEKTIEQCIKSLISQKTDFKYEIIIVDSSDNDTVANIANRFTKIKFIRIKHKTFPGIARNIGANEARGALLVFVDSDVVVSECTIQDAIMYSKTGHSVFAGAVDYCSQNKKNGFKKIEWFFEFNSYYPSMREGTRWCLPAVFLAVSREIFVKEKFINMETGEDVELSARLHNDGNILYFTPKIRVFHVFQSSFSRLFMKSINFGIGDIEIRLIYNVPGSYFIHKPFLKFLAIPGFALIKLAKITYRNVRYNRWRDKFLYFCFLPIILILILGWMLGAYTRIMGRQ